MYSDRRKTVWYVEIKGNTNEIAMEDLARTCDATQDKFERHKDPSGIPHQLLCVERSFINTLEKNQRKFNLLYTIFKKREGETCVRVWKFEVRKKLHRAKKFKEAEMQVKRLKLKKSNKNT